MLQWYLLSPSAKNKWGGLLCRLGTWIYAHTSTHMHQFGGGCQQGNSFFLCFWILPFIIEADIVNIERMPPVVAVKENILWVNSITSESCVSGTSCCHFYSSHLSLRPWRCYQTEGKASLDCMCHVCLSPQTASMLVPGTPLCIFNLMSSAKDAKKLNALLFCELKLDLAHAIYLTLLLWKLVTSHDWISKVKLTFSGWFSGNRAGPQPLTL